MFHPTRKHKNASLCRPPHEIREPRRLAARLGSNRCAELCIPNGPRYIENLTGTSKARSLLGRVRPACWHLWPLQGLLYVSSFQGLGLCRSIEPSDVVRLDAPNTSRNSSLQLSVNNLEISVPASPERNTSPRWAKTEILR